jgi:POT family proton-dependent oligopeptide transporter
VPAIFMMVGVATYLSGYRYLPARVRRESARPDRLGPADRRIVLALVGVMAITVFQSAASYQVYNVMPIWTEQHVALEVGGFRIPAPWYQSAWALFSILGVPPVLWWWRRQAVAGREPDDVGKIGMGAWITAASNLVLVAAILGAGDDLVAPLWPLLYVVGLGISFIYYWPTLLALVSRAAPPAVNATLMGVAMMTLFVSNTLIGWIGGWYERMPSAGFWAMHAAIAACGGLLIAAFGRRITEVLKPADQ